MYPAKMAKEVDMASHTGRKYEESDKRSGQHPQIAQLITVLIPFEMQIDFNFFSCAIL